MPLPRNRFRRNDTGDPEGAKNDPEYGVSSLGFYHDIPSTGDPRPHIGYIGAASEDELGSVTGSASRLLTEHRNSTEELSRTKTNGKEKTKGFSKFNLSLTAPPPKSKPKQPGQVPAPVRVGGRGGAGNIKQITQDNPPAAVSPGSSEIPKYTTVPTAVESSRARQPLPESETADPVDDGLSISPGGREMAIPRMKHATSGRGGAGNLHQHVLEDGVFQRVIAHEDVLIRQRREMQSDKVAHRTGRGGVGNVKRSDDEPDWEHSCSSPCGGSGLRGGTGSGRIASTSTGSSGTTPSSGASVEVQTSIPDNATHPVFQPLPPLPNEALEPLSSVLEQGSADVSVARDGGVHVGRVGSPLLVHRTVAVRANPPGTTTKKFQSEETQGRVGSRPPSPPDPYLPPDHPHCSHESGDNGRGRLFITNPDDFESMATSRLHAASTLDGPGGCLYSHSSRGPPRETPLSSQYRHPQYPIYVTSSQRAFEEVDFSPFGVVDRLEDQAEHARPPSYTYLATLSSPTIVLPPTPSTVFEETPLSRLSGGTKETRIYDVNWPRFPPNHERPDIDRVRELGADEDRRVNPDLVSKSQEEGKDASYSDLFEKPMGAFLETGSVNSSGAGTPLSDQSSILVPRRTSHEALLSVAKKAQDLPANPQLAAIPHVPSTTPTSRSRLQPEEVPYLHRDELNLPPHKPLSRMERAILRQVEFGSKVDFLTLQLS